MSKYLKLFETTSQYEAYMGGGEKILPNVSLIEETNKVEYNPYIPPQPITYTASEKLDVTWSDETATFGATIKSHTFENGVGTIEFNDYVTKIDDSAFMDCSGLTNITIPNSVTYIGWNAFSYCSSLTSVTIPNGVTSIGMNAFESCSSLTSITIPNSVTSIDGYAFAHCRNLTSVTIPNSVTIIGMNVFNECTNLVMIDVESGNTTYDSRDNCNAIIETATNTLIIGCQNTTIPNTVTSIGDEAFNGCTNLESITIPDSVTTIGYGAFASCSGLTSITIPNNVTSIGINAFGMCTNLESITIPNSVTSIDLGAFCMCTNLTSVTVEATTPPTLGSDAFYSNASDRKIYVPAESIEAYKSAIGWSDYADDIEAIPT